MKERLGFTLIELMIVVLVIGILAAVGIPRYQAFMMESRQKSCASQLKSIDQAVSVWETNNVAIAPLDVCRLTFSSQTGKILIREYYKSPAYTDVVGDMLGMLPEDRDIIDIVKDGRGFVCPELAYRYGNQEYVPDNDRINYNFFKIDARETGGYTGYHDFVPYRIGRAAVCPAFGYNNDGGLSITGPSGWGAAPNGTNGQAPKPAFTPGAGGPDRTRASLHITWQGSND